MARQIERRLRGQKLRPYQYRDFGSLVSLGKWSTVGNLMGFLLGRSFFVEGLFAQIMYRSLRVMHGLWSAFRGVKRDEPHGRLTRQGTMTYAELIFARIYPTRD